MYVKVTGTNFVRDTNSMAIINTDVNDKNEYYNKVKLLSLQKQEINTLKDEIDIIRSDMSEIKQLMVALINKV
jgi:hypothetical protein